MRGTPDAQPAKQKELTEAEIHAQLTPVGRRAVEMIRAFLISSERANKGTGKPLDIDPDTFLRYWKESR